MLIKSLKFAQKHKFLISNGTKNLFIALIIFLPVLTFAEIVPNCSPNCGYYDLLKLINNIINWIITISVPIAAGVFAWAGIKYMTTGVMDQKAEAKEMLRKVLVGFVAILSAWIIVTTITNALLKPEFKTAVPVEGVK
jgi:hypothetical protein